MKIKLLGAYGEGFGITFDFLWAGLCSQRLRDRRKDMLIQGESRKCPKSCEIDLENAGVTTEHNYLGINRKYKVLR